MGLNVVNIEGLCEMTGQTFRTVRKRLAGLEPVQRTNRGIYYDAVHALPLLFPKEKPSEQLSIERARLTKIQAELAKIDLDKLRNNLIPIEEVVGELACEYDFVRGTLRCILTDSLVERIRIETDPAKVQTLLADAINQGLEELSDDARQKLS
jgi:hypothetical protein